MTFWKRLEKHSRFPVPPTPMFMLGVLLRNFTFELNVMQPSQVSKFLGLGLFVLQVKSFWYLKPLRKGDNETWLLLLIVCVIYLTKACISLVTAFLTLFTLGLSSAGESSCAAPHAWAQVPGPQVEKHQRRRGPQHWAYFCISYSWVKSVPPFQFWVIRFIYYFIYFSKFHFAFQTIFIYFWEGFLSAVSHRGRCFYWVQMMIVEEFGKCLLSSFL